MAKWKKIVSIILAAVCIGMCTAFLLPEEAAQVKTTQAQKRKLTVSTYTTGVWEPQGQSAALPAMSGVVRDVYVQTGDTVQRGQPLYRMDSSLLEAQLSAALAKEALLASVSDRIAGLEAYETALIQTEADTLCAQIALCTVRAPQDGEVLSVGVEPGSPAQGGVVIGTGARVVRAYIPDASMEGISVGQIAVVRRGRTERRARIASLSPSTAQAGVFEAVLNPVVFADLQLGMQVEVEIIREEISAVCVPIEALYAGEDAVLCVIGGVCVKAPVELGEQDAYYIAVSGIAEGTQVVLHPDGIAEGTQVSCDAQK